MTLTFELHTHAYIHTYVHIYIHVNTHGYMYVHVYTKTNNVKMVKLNLAFSVCNKTLQL